MSKVTKKKPTGKLFRIYLNRGKMTPSLVAVRRGGTDPASAVKSYLSANERVPGNGKELKCGHKSISTNYTAEAV